LIQTTFESVPAKYAKFSVTKPVRIAA